MSNVFKRFIANESGATAVEYALIAGVMAIGVIAAATSLGTKLKTGFGTLGDSVTNNTGAVAKAAP